MMTKTTILKTALNSLSKWKTIIPLVILLINSAKPLEGAASGGQRYLTLHTLAAYDFSVFKAQVDSAKAKGFNTISLVVPWSYIEGSQNQFDFSWLDQRIDYVESQGLKVVLKITYTFYPSWINDYYLMKEESGKTYQVPQWREVGKDGTIIIADSQVRQWMEQLLVKVVKQYENRYSSNPIVYYGIAFTGAEESEYGYDKFLDYSPQAQADFQIWLQNEYATLNSLNQRWGTSYSSFSNVAIPKSEQYGSSAWADWMNYRTFDLKRLFDQMAKAVHDSDKDAKFAVQFGSIWDYAGSVRGTYDAAKLTENVDWITLGDAPCYNHKFSMDILRTIAKGKLISNEIDSPGTSSRCARDVGSTTAQVVLNQGLEIFAYGGDMVRFFNWDGKVKACDSTSTDPEMINWCKIVKSQGYIEGDFYINQPVYASTISQLAQEAKNPVSSINPKIAMYVSTMAQFLTISSTGEMSTGVDTYRETKDTYGFLTDNETKPIAIITDSVFDNDPSVLSQYPDGIYLPSFNKIISDSAYTALSQARVPLYAEDSSVGTKNEYGEDRTPTIFSPYPPPTGVSSPQTIILGNFELHQNYPNPFNPTTRITFQLAKSAFVNLSIYNVGGQLVEVLVTEHKNPGHYSVEWKASEVGSGVYFYRIKAGEFAETKKCLVLK